MSQKNEKAFIKVQLDVLGITEFNNILSVPSI